MQDRVSLYPGRVKLVPVAGQENTYDMVRADSPTQEGTPLNKDSLLKDATAALYGLGADAVPDDMWGRIIPKGTILWYSKNEAPVGFLVCDGSQVAIADYPELYAVLGNTFGTATSTKFFLPDLRAAFIRGAGTQNGYSATFGAKQEATNTAFSIEGTGPATYMMAKDYDKSVSEMASMAYDNISSKNNARFYFRPFNMSLLPIIKY